MTDLALQWNAETLAADLVVAGDDLGVAEDLQGAILISLFTDRRAPNSQAIDGSDRRGWWGDTFPDVSDDQLGSLLWLLARELQTPEVLERARGYASEALQWLIDDRLARRVDVLAEYPQRGVLALTITLRTRQRRTVRTLFQLERGAWFSVDESGVSVPIGGSA